MRKALYFFAMISMVVISCTQKQEEALDKSVHLMKSGLSQGGEKKVNMNPDKQRILKEDAKVEEKSKKENSGEKNDVSTKEGLAQGELKANDVKQSQLDGDEKNQSTVLENEEYIIEKEQNMIKGSDKVTNESLAKKSNTEISEEESTEPTSVKATDADVQEPLQKKKGGEELTVANGKVHKAVQKISAKETDLSGVVMESSDIEGEKLLAMQNEDKWKSIRETDAVLSRISNILKDD